ncbi:MAG: T9SS type A sorting domain-containing protein [Chitinophagales bacterium]
MKLRLLLLTLAPALAFAVSPVTFPTTSKLTAKELNDVDLSGKYVGKRHQYAYDHRSVMQSFDYEFELKQEGKNITGYSTILRSNGEYADILLRGTIVGDVLYFEEYQVKSKAVGENFVWCMKSGGLQIRKSDGQLKLIGSTESFQEGTYYPCTGGYTDLTKTDNSELHLSKTEVKEELPQSGFMMSATPNPFETRTAITYELKNDAVVSLEIFDIHGRIVTVAENKIQKPAGTYHIDFSGEENHLAAGVFIVKLTVGSEIHSMEIVKQ